MRSPRPTRYTVLHFHQAYPGYPIERATVSYSADLVDPVGRRATGTYALSCAINTANRYHGNILTEYDDGSAAITRRYLQEAPKPTPVTVVLDPELSLPVSNGSTR